MVAHHFVINLMKVDFAHFIHDILALERNKSKASEKGEITERDQLCSFCKQNQASTLKGAKYW